jgi:asparagine synthase (glutamine-hydrolysing)
MCGIAGIVTWRPTADLAPLVRTMTDALAHRGPNGAGDWTDDAAGIGLGHRRLAVIDISDRGHQPMVSESGRLVITCNGTIYNFAALRQELERAGSRPAWRGHSDTEVLLACIEHWGIERTLQRAIGMFALAVWDREARTLTLARDRIGEKPLYYGLLGGRFVFASDLNAIRRAFPKSLEIDREAVAGLMRSGYIGAPRTIFQGIFKLQAAHTLVTGGADRIGECRRYWNLADRGEHPGSPLEGHSDDELISRAGGLIDDAVKLQTVSDVPTGAWLSGGIDSSLVVASLQAQTNHQVRTFTLGFEDQGFDEAPYARAVARHLNTNHSEMYISSGDAAKIIPTLPEIYSEPFADSSQIPTAILAKMTARQVTVALSGDGGDELFAGYPRYGAVLGVWRSVRRIPSPLRRWIGRTLQILPEYLWNTMLPANADSALSGGRIHRLGRIFNSNDIREMYTRLMCNSGSEDHLVYGSQQAARPAWSAGASHLDTIRRMDLLQYLPDDLLVKTDRAAMSTGLECRSPLLDHRLVEFAFALPDRALVRNGTGKWLLRRMLRRYMPPQFVNRPKSGFAIPVADWLRGPLQGWASDLLATPSLDRAGFLNSAKISAVWRQHLSGKVDRSSLLWSVLMFQAWLEHYKS